MLKTNNKKQKKILKYTFIINLIILFPILLRKPPIKDWLIVYLFNAATNSFLDNILSRKKIVKYPVRILPKLFNTHILFDFFIYPTFTIFYNQITYKDKPFPIFYKLVIITIPVFIIELIAERKTELVKWSRKWKWYHSLFSIIIKSLLTRCLISLIRRIDRQTKEKG